MKIVIETIPHSKQRYDTVGDWFYDSDGTLQIKVSNMNYTPFESLIGVHELCEALICGVTGVTQEQVDQFDFTFKGDGEPGDNAAAPYHKAHNIASGIERIMCSALNLPWSSYDETVTHCGE